VKAVCGESRTHGLEGGKTPQGVYLSLSEALIEQIPFPPRAAADALHIAIAVVSGMDYLLTWNCTHIANAALRSAIESICRSRGYDVPIICTPEELLQEE